MLGGGELYGGAFVIPGAPNARRLSGRCIVLGLGDSDMPRACDWRVPGKFGCGELAAAEDPIPVLAGAE
jgi:hypothetical protein